jgi:hypothetical protein
MAWIWDIALQAHPCVTSLTWWDENIKRYGCKLIAEGQCEPMQEAQRHCAVDGECGGMSCLEDAMAECWAWEDLIGDGSETFTEICQSFNECIDAALFPW